ncbi:hypothetical protein ABWH97_13910 [Nitratireductor sp. ac15]
MIRFGNFEPDRAAFEPTVSNVIVNAQPVRDGWGPIADLVEISDALGDTCLGAVYVRQTTGAFRIIAGTETGLYELNTADYSWTDRTGVSGPYSVPAGDAWSFAVFGDSLIAVNKADPPQYISIDAGTSFADLPGNPPRAKYIAVASEFVVLGHLASDPKAVQTSEIGDAGGWTLGKNGCDIQTFPDGEEVQGLLGAERGAIVIQRSMIRQMTISFGGAYSFTTAILNPDRGAIAPRSIAQIGPGQFFYYSADGFSLGAEGRKIGAERVDGWFLSEIADEKIGEIRSVADPYEKIVWTQASRVDGTKFLVGYNWQLDRWCYADNNVSEMMPLTTPGMSWDGLANLYSSIDEIDVPFDSALFMGGQPRFAAFTTDNKLGFFTGTAREATLETADIEFSPGARSFLREARVYTDADDFTLAVGTQEYHGGARSWGMAVTPFSSTKTCHFRKPARLHRFRMVIPAGEDWNHVVGIEATANREGKR